MPRFRNIDGVSVEMTPQEEAQLNAEEAAFVVEIAQERANAFNIDYDLLPPVIKAFFDELETDNPGLKGRARARHDTP